MLFAFEGYPLGLATVVRGGEIQRWWLCSLLCSSQHPDLLISTGAAVPVSSCAYAVTAHRRLFTYAASKALVRKQERRGVERFSVWKGIHFPLH